DITQIDLPRGVKSGLVEARSILKGVTGIGIVHLTRGDVVRHALVQEIIAAYERAEGRAGTEDDHAARGGEEISRVRGGRA
ncbi:MAG TPA: PhoH family protein, partial [Candidatus Hydrogenedentes bacterium]|nr:PhoH family protein [Candidatus Hydrogenedentota bacterium]